MLHAFINRQLDKAEKETGESVDYLRFMLKASLPTLMKFSKIVPISNYRKKLPAEAYHVARVVAVRDEDCGPCVQTCINLAKSDGIGSETLAATYEERPADLTPELSDVYHFTKAVVEATGEDDIYRPRIVERWGEATLAELALAIATARTYPITKRALGYATSCSKVKIRTCS